MKRGNNPKDSSGKPTDKTNTREYGRKGRKGGNKNQNTDSYVSNKQTALSSLNDISWYAQYPELLAAAARIPFPNKPGMVMDPGAFASLGSPTYYKKGIPGVMALNYMPSIGYSNGPQSPASIVAKEMWARIRSKFSSSLDEDPPDLFMYTIALDNAHAFIAEVKRVYKLINRYTPYNRDFPENVLVALGLTQANIDYWLIHKMDLYGLINTMVHKINKFSVPNNMDLFNRHRFMNENVYLDRNSANAQSYVFVADGYYHIDDTGSNGTELHYAQKSNVYDSESTLMAYFDQMCDALSTWDDAYTICGHIERAYEGEMFYRAELISQDEFIDPVYVPEVLTQIENARAMDVTGNKDIKQDPVTNSIIFTPTTVADGVFNPILNLDIDNPTAADVTIATRLTCVGAFGALATPIFGTEIVLNFSIVNTAVLHNNPPVRRTYTYNACFTTNNSTDWHTNVFDNLRHALPFNHRPLSIITWFTGTDYQGLYCFDIKNMSYLTTDQLFKINQVCLYSEFNCFRR